MTPIADRGAADLHEDAAGNLWLCYGSNNLIFRLQRPDMQTELKGSISKIVTAPTVQFEWVATADTKMSRDVRCVWRLNNGPWSEPTEKSSATISLPGDGKYVFEVTSIGPHASLDATPAKAEFEVRIDYDRVIAEQLRLFQSKDFAAREKAGATCVQLGRACLPALRKALSDAPPDLAWWIKSAIAQIEAKQPK
jgi:hypothetical protein